MSVLRTFAWCFHILEMSSTHRTTAYHCCRSFFDGSYERFFHSVMNDSLSALPWKYDPEQMIRTFLKTPVVFSGFSTRVARIFPEVRPTFSTKSGNLYEAKRTKRGWVSLMVSFWASSPHCFCVFLHNYLSFALFCSFFRRWNKLKLKPSIFPLEIIERIKKMKNAMIYWPQGQWGGVKARYCAPVYSCAVTWSRKTRKNVCGHRVQRRCVCR